jgi:hypothetical protein
MSLLVDKTATNVVMIQKCYVNMTSVDQIHYQNSTFLLVSAPNRRQMDTYALIIHNFH